MKYILLILLFLFSCTQNKFRIYTSYETNTLKSNELTYLSNFDENIISFDSITIFYIDWKAQDRGSYRIYEFPQTIDNRVHINDYYTIQKIINLLINLEEKSRYDCSCAHPVQSIIYLYYNEKIEIPSEDKKYYDRSYWIETNTKILYLTTLGEVIEEGKTSLYFRNDELIKLLKLPPYPTEWK